MQVTAPANLKSFIRNKNPRQQTHSYGRAFGGKAPPNFYVPPKFCCAQKKNLGT